MSRASRLLGRALRRAEVLALYGWPGRGLAAPAGRVTCLLYHRITEREDRPYLEKGGVPVTPPSVFQRHLRLLRSEGFVFVGLEEVLEGRLPDRPSVLVTFDDGFRDNFTTALSILREEKVPAVFFVVSSIPGRPRLLWEHALCRTLADTTARTTLLEEVSEIAGERLRSDDLARTVRCRVPASSCDALLERHEPDGSEEEARALYPSWGEVRQALLEGHAIGSHGWTHRMRHLLSAEEFRREISESRRQISGETGGAVDAYSYPFNSYLFGDEETCRGEGYRFVATVDPGRIALPGSLLRVPRLTVHRLHDSAAEFRRLLAEAKD